MLKFQKISMSKTKYHKVQKPIDDSWVAQGEREMADDNKELGKFDLVGIPPAPRGVPQIEVGFDIDANGIVNVSAKDKATNKEQNIVIQSSGGLSDSDIERMVQEAEANVEADKERKEGIEARNDADSLKYNIEKQLADYSEKLPEDVQGEIQAAIDALGAALEGEDTEAIKEATQELNKASMKIGEALNQAGGDAGAEGAGEEKAKEADFEEKGDEKKDDEKKQ